MHAHKPFEFLEHTADVKFLAYGTTLEEAFTNCVLATTAVMTDLSKIQPKIEKKIHVSAPLKRTLLYDFLQELVVFLDTEGFIACQVSHIKITEQNEKNKGYLLDATLLGDCADHYEVHTAVKSVTYSDMFIKEEKDLVTIQVVHDL